MTMNEAQSNGQEKSGPCSVRLSCHSACTARLCLCLRFVLLSSSPGSISSGLPACPPAGCIPVFVGEPFHTLPLAGDVDYKSFALFVNVSDNSPWVNTSSPKWEHNHMVSFFLRG